MTKVCSVLDMTTYAPQCKKRNHEDRHTDAGECDAYEAEDIAARLVDLYEQVADNRRILIGLREHVAEAETEIANDIREALSLGASPTKLARATGLSRERIYQIKDNRR